MSAFVVAVEWSDASPGVTLDAAERALGGFVNAGWWRFQVNGFSASSAATGGAAREGISSSSLIALFDGRLSTASRRQVRAKLGDAADAAGSDAALITLAWSALREQLAPLLEGDFALAIFDRRIKCLWLLRSRGGACGLHFVRRSGSLFVATRPSAALIAAGVSLEEEPDSVAAFFALRAPAINASYFKGVTSLAPGAMHRVDALGGREASISAPGAHSAIRFYSDIEARDAWNAALVEAVNDSLIDARRPAIMLSGGLDSSTLAAIAAHKRSDLLACSWALPGTPTADEQPWISATTHHLNIAARVINGDRDWPLAQLMHWPVEDDGPLANPYQWLHQRLYAAAGAAGCDAMLSGNFGDHLYPAAGDWLRSGIRERGLAWVLGQELQLFRQKGPRALWHDPGWRTLLRARSETSSGTWVAPLWLMPNWRAALHEKLGPVPDGIGADSAEAIQDAEMGRRFHAMHGIELLTPYRDPRVIILARALPGYFQYRQGQSKYLTREAMRGALPESVRQRPKGGSLVPFFCRGLLQNEQQTVIQLLDAPDARWSNFVTQAALTSARTRTREKTFTESDLLLIWLCLSYELWWRAHWAGGPAVLASRSNWGDVIEAFRD